MMRRWLSPSISRLARPRCLSTVAPGFHHGIERVSVPCGSSGNVFIDLHNIAKVSSSDPLLLYLPPFSTTDPGSSIQLPKLFQSHPTAVIHYRWMTDSPHGKDLSSPGEGESDALNARFHPGWPAPIHDTLRAYSWITENLSPATYSRRDMYVYGSYLGASLATSLALTETHPHERMGLRGCIAYNGIYNWTMFLPDHPMNKPPKTRSAVDFLEEILEHPGDHDFEELRLEMSELFRTPEDLFDPFASPCLFFHTPGLLVPPAFDASAIPTPSPLASVSPFNPDEIIEPVSTFKAQRKSPLGFPPKKSTLKIPEILLLHNSAPRPPPLAPSFQRRQQRRKKDPIRNNFRTQAEELASLMRRSINKVELKERLKWDSDFVGYNEEADRRVQVYDAGENAGFGELAGHGDETAVRWLEDLMSSRPR
ncbi:hypothetical protein F5Y15DRAFT_170324 [Xylariaceae sp. FL0016]|nr:hypothetical protein F5Y15DRAFT_170324 [Xylariaceae sp. FL0016]